MNPFVSVVRVFSDNIQALTGEKFSTSFINFKLFSTDSKTNFTLLYPAKKIRSQIMQITNSDKWNESKE